MNLSAREEGARLTITVAAVVIMAFSVSFIPGCASAPPSYSAVGQKAFNADQLFKDVQALSETAINLNAATGKEHLKDRDTALVRDFALSAGAALQSYANGGGNLAVVVQGFHQLMANLSSEASVNERLRFFLTLIDSSLNRIPVQ